MDQNNKRERRKSSWGKPILISIAVLCVLLIAAWFVLTSSAFLKSVILPKVGKSLNAKITVGDASISPFSRVELNQLRVETTGTEPLLTAQQVVLRYSLMDIIGGNIHVEEASIISPVVQIIQEPDGSSNLDPILKSSESSKSEEKPKSSEPMHLNIKNVALKNGVVRQLTKKKGGGSKLIELQNLNVTLDQLGNGLSGKLGLGANFAMEEKSGATNNSLKGDLNGTYDIALNQQLLPASLKGSAQLKVNSASGSYQDANGISMVLGADLTPQMLKEVALKFAKSGTELGQVRVSGPLDLEKKEGNLKIEVLSLDKNILNLAGGGSGWDFGQSRINSTNQVAISQNASFFAANGTLAGRDISVSQGDMKTPSVNLNLDYQASVNLADKSAVLERLNLGASREGQQFLSANLDRQMNLSWGQTVKGYKDAALGLVLTNFNLADWKPVLGTNIGSGMVNSHVSVTSRQDGKLLNTEIASTISNLSAQIGSNKIDHATLNFQANGTVEDLKLINIPDFKLSLAQNNAPVLEATGAARYSLETKETSAQVSGSGALSKLLALVPVEGANASAGNLKLSVTYSDNAGKKVATGNLGIEQFTGGYADYRFNQFQVAFEYNVSIAENVLEIARASATFSQGFDGGGSVDLKGRYNLDKKSGQFEFKTVDLNENTFRPLLAPSLGENKLVSISLNSSGTATLDPAAETSIKADVKVDKWVVQDKAGTLPTTPLSLQLTVDGGMREQAIDLRKLALQLSPTDRAKNLLQLEGKIDLSKTNPAPSKIALSSESLDVTPFYNMFAGGSTNATAGTAQAPSPANAPVAVATTNQEPAAMNLPFQELTADLKIDRFYLREVAISNWVGNVSIKSNIVTIKPFQFNLNGGPVNFTGTFNVGVPGYVYDIAFSANQVPLAPLANTFSTNNANQLQGTFEANAGIKGAGTTGASLKKSLAGDASINLTNLNYQILGPKLKKIMVPISIALNAPELVQSPINWVSAQTDIGNGEIRLKHLGVESDVFFAESAGTIAIADVLTNSTLNLPINLSIARGLAEKIKMAGNTPPDAKFAKLPQFVTIKGTIGDPRSDINKTALLGAALKEAAALGIGSEKTEKVLGTLGNVLTGEKGTNSTGTNASPGGGLLKGLGGLLNPNASAATNGTNNASTNANANPAAGLLQSLGGLLNQGHNNPTNASTISTNQPATNAPAANEPLSPFDLLRGLQKKK
jgi:hypothetical protein